MSRALGLIVFLLGSTLLGGCADLPSAEPFAAATAALGPAIDAAYDAAEESQRDVVLRLESIDDAEYTPDQQMVLESLIDANKDNLDRVADERRYRAYVSGALADYASSLASITEAGKSGAKSAEQVADAVTGLLDNFSQLVPGAGALQIPSNVVDVAKGLYQEVAKIRAARAMDEALSAAHPIIQKLGAALLAESPDVLIIISKSTDSSLRAIALEYKGELDYRKEILKQRADLYASVRTALADANSSDPTVQARVQLLEERLAFYDGMIARTEAWHSTVEHDRATVSAAGERGRRVVRASDEAVEVWVQSHASLVAAFKASRTLDPAALINVIDRLRRLAYQEGG